MTVLITGGRGAGKRAFAARAFGLQDADFVDGGSCTKEELAACAALDGLHRLTRRLLDQGEPFDGWTALLQDKIVLCDELGCGVVPIDRRDDDWRERTGRLCCDLAAQADLVVRVVAGLPQVLKGVAAWD